MGAGEREPLDHLGLGVGLADRALGQARVLGAREAPAPGRGEPVRATRDSRVRRRMGMITSRCGGSSVWPSGESRRSSRTAPRRRRKPRVRAPPGRRAVPRTAATRPPTRRARGFVAMASAVAGRRSAARRAVCTNRSAVTTPAPSAVLIRAISSPDRCCNSMAIGPEHAMVSVPGDKPARQGDRGERRADDARPVGQHLCGAGRTAAERGAGEAGHQRADRARAVDVPRLPAIPYAVSFAAIAPSRRPSVRRPNLRAHRRPSLLAACAGTTAIAATCPGAHARARPPIPTASGSARSCCNRPPSPRRYPTMKAS